MNYKKFLFVFLVFSLLIASGSMLPAYSQENPAFTGKVAGVVLDAEGEPVADALVILFDSRTGIPVHPKTSKPVTHDKSMAMDYFRTLTDEHGHFQLTGMAAGTYRIMAQSVESGDKADAMFGARSKKVQLRGYKNNITVPSDRALNITLKPLGTGAVHVPRHAPNDDAYLVISTEPPVGDPALGFMGWGAKFLKNIICVNRMIGGETTVTGLPEGELYLAEFANDSKPGFGAVSLKSEAGKTAEARIPIVAEWSNGVHTPPERLRPLYNRALKEANLLNSIYKEYENMPPTSRPDPVIYDEWLSQEITLDDGAEYILADFLAVEKYIIMGKKDAPKTKVPINYSDSFKALYERLRVEYPAFELKGIDWKAVGREFMPRLEKIDNDNDFGILCAELIARLKDSHAVLLEGTAKFPEVEYPFYHPGFGCLEDDRGEPVVYHVMGDSPAAKAGIRPGMTLVSVNGKPARQVIDEIKLILKKYTGYSSERYLDYHAYRFCIRQVEQNSKVSLKFTRIDGSEFSCEVRASIKGGYLNRLPVPNRNISESANVDWKKLDDGLGYIYVRRMRGDLNGFLDTAVRDMKDSKGLIIDVRGNSGGGFDAATAHFNFTLDNERADPKRPRFTGPIAMLIDSRCISAAEGWTSWFIANDRARLFGETTAGASSRKREYNLKNGLYKVRYPNKMYKGFLDRPIEMLGLPPDVQVMPNAKDIAEGRDTVLEAAKEYLLGLE